MTQRKWLAECHAWLDDPENVEFIDEVDHIWVVPVPESYDPIMCPNMTWRIKPATILVNGVKCPKNEITGKFYVRISWGTETTSCVMQDSRWLTYSSEADARKVYEALIAPFGGVK